MIALGIMVNDSSGSGAGVDVTVTAAVAETIEPSGFVNSAVILLVPALTPAARPVEFTVATEGMLELHLICLELVTSCCTPVPEVARAMNCPVCPDAETDCDPGIMVTAVYCSEVPFVTVKVAVPVTAVPVVELE